MSSTGEETSGPPVKRRRSSLLKRKSIGPVVVLHTREVAIREYICEAKEEKQDWADLYHQQKSQLSIAQDVLDEASSDPPTFTFENLQSDLTEEDLKNMKQPDYGKLCSDINNFIETAAIIKTRIENLNSLIDLNYLLARSRLNALSKHICSYNDKAPLWKQDPSKYRKPKV